MNFQNTIYYLVVKVDSIKQKRQAGSQAFLLGNKPEQAGEVIVADLKPAGRFSHEFGLSCEGV